MDKKKKTWKHIAVRRNATNELAISLSFLNASDAERVLDGGMLQLGGIEGVREARARCGTLRFIY